VSIHEVRLPIVGPSQHHGKFENSLCRLSVPSDHVIKTRACDAVTLPRIRRISTLLETPERKRTRAMSSPTRRIDFLFLCVANSARSQLAEGIARSILPDSIGVHSERIKHVITLCEEEVCPFPPGNVERSHWPLPEPAGDGPNSLESVRAARDEVKRRLETLLDDEGINSP
jgi:arsenate reductase